MNVAIDAAMVAAGMLAGVIGLFGGHQPDPMLVSYHPYTMAQYGMVLDFANDSAADIVVGAMLPDGSDILIDGVTVQPGRDVAIGLADTEPLQVAITINDPSGNLLASRTIYVMAHGMTAVDYGAAR